MCVGACQTTQVTAIANADTGNKEAHRGRFVILLGNTRKPG
jgi:hypothetical protein